MNPLAKFYRQPKVYISLPSNGIFYDQDTFQGDPFNVPVFGMTGMDEILMQTPDALLSGDSTVKVIESCCPSIKDAWNLVSIDLDVILAAIRIATFGNSMDVRHVCPKCHAENDYSVDVSEIIDHFKTYRFTSSAKLPGLTAKLQPLTYRQSTKYALQNFELQQKLAQLTDSEEHKAMLADIFKQLGEIQQSVYADSVESVDTGSEVVSEREFIQDWVKNIDRTTLELIKQAIKVNRDAAVPPAKSVQCDVCNEVSHVNIEMDHSSFFVKA